MNDEQLMRRAIRILVFMAIAISWIGAIAFTLEATP